MRKVLFVLITAMLFIVGCSEDNDIHENVDENIAKDSRQVMEIITRNVDEGIAIEDLEGKDKAAIDKYYDLYFPSSSCENCGEGDKLVLLIGTNSVMLYQDGFNLESDFDKLAANRESMEKVITTGELYEKDSSN